MAPWRGRPPFPPQPLSSQMLTAGGPGRGIVPLAFLPSEPPTPQNWLPVVPVTHLGLHGCLFISLHGVHVIPGPSALTSVLVTVASLADL